MPRDILIDPQRTGSGNPNIQFSGSAGNTLRLEVLSEGSVQFVGVSGSLLKISDFPAAGGALNSLFLSGTTAVTGSILPGVTGLYDLGSSGNRWANVYANSISGSLTNLSNGSSYLIAGSNVTIATGSSGAVTISAPNLAPSTSAFVTIGNDASLSAERSLTAGTGLSLTDGGANSTVSLGINDSVVATVSGTRFTGQVTSAVDIVASGTFKSLNSSGDEGGEIFLSKSVTNTTLNTGVTIDVYQNRVRIFETGGTNRGGYWDVSSLSAGVGTNFLASSATPGGSDTYVQFNDGGSFGGVAGFTFTKASNLLKVSNLSGSLTSSNVSAGQVVVAGPGGVLSGTNDFVWDNSNTRLGIGTASPAQALHVRGSTGGDVIALVKNDGAGRAVISLDSGGSSDSNIRFLNGGINKWSILNTPTDLGFYNYATSGYPLFIAASTGNIGVNTTATSAAKLTVSGSSTASTPTMIVREGVSSPTSGAGTFDVQNSAGTSVLFVTGSGGVGISTNNPLGSKLYVSSSLSGNAASALIVGGQVLGVSLNTYKAQTHLFQLANTTEAMRIDSSGNVGIGTASIDSRLVINGNSVFSGSVSPDGDLTRDLGAATKRWRNIYAASISGSLTGSNVSAGQVVVAGTGGVLSGSNNLFWSDSNGRLGIGSSSPGYELQIGNGSTVGTRTLAVIDSGYGIKLAGGNGNGIVQSLGTTVPLEFQAGNGNNGNYIFSSTGNVGIGTATVTSKLHVYTTQNDAMATPSVDINAAFVRLGDATTGLTFNNGVGIKFHDAGNVHYSIGQLSGNFYMSQTSDNGNVLFSSGRTDVIVFNSSGNVGIGSTSPGYKLDVNGDINLASTRILRVNGTSVINTQGSNGSDIYVNARVVRNESSVNTDGLYLGYGNSGTTTGHIRFFANGTTERMKIAADTGSVIVSDLAGSVSTSAARLLVSGSSTGTVTTLLAKHGIANGASLPVMDLQNSAGGTLMFVSASGAVGIGTTSPSYPLHVYRSGLADGSTNTHLILDGKFSVAGIDSNDIIGISSRLENSGGGSQTTFNIGFSYQSSGNAVLLQPSAGNVGIGTNAPLALLHVGAGNDTPTVSATAYVTALGTTNLAIRDATNNVELLNYAFSGGGLIGTVTNHSLGIRTGNTTALTIDTSQNAGIGSTTPSVTGIDTGVTRLFVVAPNSNTGMAATFIADSSGRGILVADQGKTNSFAVSLGSSLATIGTNTSGTVLALSVAATERMRIDTSGNVGIGTNAMGDKLAVNGSMSVTGSLLPGTDNLYSLGSSSKRWNNVYATSISGSLTGSNVSAGQVVVAGTGGVLSGSNSLWWDNTNERVGIGTSSATAKLTIYSSAASTNLRIGDVYSGYVGITLNGSTSDANYNFLSRASDQDLYINRPSGQRINIREGNGTNQIVVASAGNVGIGTATVSPRLHVYGPYNTSANTVLHVESGSLGTGLNSGLAWNGGDMATFQYSNGNTSYLKIKGVRHTAVSDWTGASTRIQQVIDSTNMAYIDFNPVGGTYALSLGTGIGPTEALRIDSSQNVGIGTTSPNSRLDVSKSTGAVDIRLSNGGTAYMNLYAGSGVGALTMLAVQNEPLILGTNNSEKVRIDSSGNVGIGTTSPAVKLHSYSTSGNNITLQSTTSNASIGLYGYSAGSMTGSIEMASGLMNLGTVTNHPINVLVNSTTAMFIDTSRRVGIGTTTPDATITNTKLHVYNGIAAFNASYGIGWIGLTGPTNGTRTSATLDHYDYGTWTPVFAGSTTAGTYTLTNTKAYYVRVGKLVVVSLYTEMTATSYSAGSGDWRITGLPYSSSSGIGIASVGKYSGLAASVATISGVVEEGNTYVDMYVTTANGAANAKAAINTYVGTSTKIAMTITFRVT